MFNQGKACILSKSYPKVTALSRNYYNQGLKLMNDKEYVVFIKYKWKGENYVLF